MNRSTGLALLVAVAILGLTAAAPAAGFDPVAATDAYVAKLPPEAIAKSNAYFEGGYWLLLWNFLVSAGISVMLLATGLSKRMRVYAESLTGFAWLQPLIYGVPYLALTTVLSFPLAVYEGYFREHEYGLLNQDFGSWLGEQAIGLGISAFIGGVVILVLYAILRRVKRAWWMWASVAAVCGFFVLTALGPVFVAPLFNKYHTLDDAAIRDPILSLARANQIPADRVYVFDASKQSKRVSANVSGVLGTMRISLTDNLLSRCSPASVKAVMAHEMGHYVLNHAYKGLVIFGVIFTVGLGLAAWGFERIIARKGGAWGIRSIADPAGLPLISLLLTTYFFIMTPVLNTVTRTMETEADAFGVNASREPEGFADAALMLSEYRKMHPGPWEEIVFYDHPSGYNRILMAMRWRAENPLDGAPADSK